MTCNCYSRTVPPADHTRRSQAARRAATQEALLDAAIESLLELGWSGTSTRGVAIRAGVSQGAQQHYFPTKAALVEAAMERRFNQLASLSAHTRVEQVLGSALRNSNSSATTGERDRAVRLLDTLWGIHHLPIMAAAFEVFAVARIDAEGPHAAKLLNRATDLALSVAEQALPTYAQRPGFRDRFLATLAVMRGCAIAALPGTEASRPAWDVLRESLLDQLDALAVEA